MYLLFVVASLVVVNRAVDCVERLVSEMSCYVQSSILNSTYSLFHYPPLCFVFLTVNYTGCKRVILV